MDCMELLTYEDRQIIANRLNDFTISHKTPENIEPWLQHWADSKNLFLTKVFDGKLIISENVSLAASEKEKQYEAERNKTHKFTHIILHLNVFIYSSF